MVEQSGVRSPTRSKFIFLCAVMLATCLRAAPGFAGVFSAATATANDDWFRLEPYKPLYFIGAYDRLLNERDPSLQNEEVQFQLSFKVPILLMPQWNGKLAFGYTQVAFWQLFNGEHSAPFRETNYAPELMANFEHETGAMGLRKIRATLGALHESNGRDVPGSRSWNRVYAEGKLDWNAFTLGLKPWYRIPEPAKRSPADTRGDDNPDIMRYLGYGELTALYRAGEFTIQATGRNNLRGSPNLGSIQLELTFLPERDVQLYLQVFDGYGENLIDYNRYNSRIGIGVLIGALP